MSRQPNTPTPNLPVDGQGAPGGETVQRVPGTQAPDSLMGGSMPQPPADSKRRGAGLLVGGLLAIGIAIAIFAGLFIAGVFGN